MARVVSGAEDCVGGGRAQKGVLTARTKALATTQSVPAQVAWSRCQPYEAAASRNGEPVPANRRTQETSSVPSVANPHRGEREAGRRPTACGTPGETGDSDLSDALPLPTNGIGVRAKGASGTRRSARPLILEGGGIALPGLGQAPSTDHTSGATRREIAKLYLHDIVDEQVLASGCLKCEIVIPGRVFRRRSRRNRRARNP